MLAGFMPRQYTFGQIPHPFDSQNSDDRRSHHFGRS